MEFRILGTLEVVDDAGGIVSISGRQRRELLALLVVHAIPRSRRRSFAGPL